MAALDYLLSEGLRVVLVECDNANRDGYRAYQGLVPTERTDLDDADVWIHLVNLCDKLRGSTVVVPAAARRQCGHEPPRGDTATAAFEALGAELDARWVITGSATVRSVTDDIYTKRLSLCEAYTVLKPREAPSATRRGEVRRALAVLVANA